MSAEDETAKMATEGFVTKYVAEYSDEHEIQPYSGTPKKDGVASAGNASTGFACGDHVHPTDTSRLAVETFNTEISNLRNSFFDNVSYDENSKKILFKNGNTVLKELPATQFIKDGMVSSVAISNEKLVISFNTDAGKEDIQIPLTDIFNPSNYYDKTAADGRFVRKEAGKGLFSGSYNDLSDKPTIPAPVDISGKLDGAAAFLIWSSEGSPYAKDVVVFKDGCLFRSLIDNNSSTPDDTSDSWDMVTLDELKQNALSSAQLAAVNSGATAAKVATWDGYAAQIALKASLADLPYALVTPGEWEFSGLSEDATGTDMAYDNGYWTLYIYYDGESDSFTAQGSENDLVVVFQDTSITATRASLPGHLCDRAGNRVVVTGDTTLTLPEIAHAGRLRDFLVRLEISGSTVPTITFAAPTGETIVYETDGDEFPVPDEAGDWLYSFTESCVAHKFAVALKKVNAVAQGGGS